MTFHEAHSSPLPHRLACSNSPSPPVSTGLRYRIGSWGKFSLRQERARGGALADSSGSSSSSPPSILCLQFHLSLPPRTYPHAVHISFQINIIINVQSCVLSQSISFGKMGVKILGTAVSHGRVRLDTGVRLHYYTAGSGPAFLLQHGVSGSYCYPCHLFTFVRNTLFLTALGCRVPKRATTGAKSSHISPHISLVSCRICAGSAIVTS